MKNPVQTYIDTLAGVTARTVVIYGGGIIGGGKPGVLTLDQGVGIIRTAMRTTRMTFMAGNGGSLAIAAHMATDFNLNGMPTTALTCPVAATSHANDFGVESIFVKQLGWFAKANDNLIVMSCSGNSPNIVEAAQYAQRQGIRVIALTGFDANNKLRKLADLYFYVPAHQYGYVQLAHETILHAACDLEMWKVKAE